MVSIARGAMTEPRLAGCTLHFVYGGRTPADICGEDMLSTLPGWGERLHYHPAVSPPPTPPAGAPGADWAGLVGYVHDIALGLFGERLAEFEIYFAGPPAMATAVQRMLVDAKVPMGQVHFDQFY
jgi:toluene monooxygenase electron transfer component